MNQDLHSFSSANNSHKNAILVNLDEFNLDEENFKPMTKGLGFHQDPKKNAVRPAPREVKTFGSAKTQPQASAILNPLSAKNSSKISQQSPSGLEAFYGAKGTSEAKSPLVSTLTTQNPTSVEKNTLESQPASAVAQFFAWLIDVLMVASFVIFTTALLVLASGIEFKVLSRLVSTFDLTLFGSSLFIIYYLLYFAILDLGGSPGKNVLGIRLVKTDESDVSVKNTFVRALVTLLSAFALFLPTLLDFQGRLSDTKVVK